MTEWLSLSLSLFTFSLGVNLTQPLSIDVTPPWWAVSWDGLLFLGDHFGPWRVLGRPLSMWLPLLTHLSQITTARLLPLNFFFDKTQLLRLYVSSPLGSSSMEFSRQESWSGLPFLSPGDLPHSGIKLTSPALQADSLLSEPPGKP